MSCWTIHDGRPGIEESYFPCADTTSGNVVSCCAAGDICMSNGFCQYTHANNVGGSGFYLAGCTSPRYQDPICRRECEDQTENDVAYDFGEGRWNCCGLFSNFTRPCNEPLGGPLTSNAPPPGLLSSVAVLVGSIATPITTITGLASPDVCSNSSGAVLGASLNTGLSTGATAGIGAGYAVLAIALALVSFLLFQEKKKARHATHYRVNSEERPFRANEKTPAYVDAGAYAPSSSSSILAGLVQHGKQRDAAAPPYRNRTGELDGYQRDELDSYQRDQLDSRETTRPSTQYTELAG